MAYESLSKLFYKDSTSNRFMNADALLQKRLQADSTFRTGITIDSGELFLAVPRELSTLTERVLRLERRVSAELRALPPIARGALVRGLVINEVVSTNELEGVHSTRRQINDLLQAQEESSTQNRRFSELARLYLELSDNSKIYPSTPADIRKIYDEVMQGEDMAGIKPDGKLFRRESVDIWMNGSKVVHAGVMPEARITEMMSRMIELAENPEIPELYSAIMAHFVFEYVHPFYDGNGRSGRYLLALYLSRPLSTLTSLSLSRVIAENKAKYYKSFRQAEEKLNHGELTFFVMNILDDVQIAQNEMLDDLQAKGVQLDELTQRLDHLVHETGIKDQKDVALLYQLAQLQLFAIFPEVQLAEMARHIELGKQMTRRHTRALEDHGLIVTATQRPLSFKLSEKAIDLLGLSS